MVEQIQRIINYAINAPSGDNSQPWRFSIKGAKLNVFNVPRADDSFYNFRERGSLVSHGALLENILISAKTLGLQADYQILPDPTDPTLILILKFIETQPMPDPLYDYIPKRHTNRKPYLQDPLTPHEQQALASSNITGIGFKILEGSENLRTLGRALSVNERLLLENKTIHDSLFKSIRWSKSEEIASGDGLYIKTLELAYPQELAFRLFKHWRVINFLNKFSIAKIVAKDTAKLYSSAGAYGLLIMRDETAASFINLGRSLQKIWLTATKLGVSLQPTAALLYLHQRIREGEVADLAEYQINLIKESNSAIKTLFQTADDRPAMLFRLGKSGAPSAVSIKHAPDIQVMAGNI